MPPNTAKEICNHGHQSVGLMKIRWSHTYTDNGGTLLWRASGTWPWDYGGGKNFGVDDLLNWLGIRQKIYLVYWKNFFGY